MQGPTIDQLRLPNYHHKAEVADSHHEEHPDHRLFGLILFLVAEGMIFIGMFGAYLAFRSVLPIGLRRNTNVRAIAAGVNTQF